MTKRGVPAFDCSDGQIARKKGRKNARPGNKNGAKGPRIGRADRPAIAPPPDPAAIREMPRQRRKRAKTGGRDFEAGTNSHDDRVFQRGRENLPRGSGTLMLRCVFHDRGEGIYRALCRVAENDKTVLAFMQEYIDRTEGRPVKKVEKTQQRVTNFIITTPDGQRQPLLPDRQAMGSGVTAAAESAEDRLVRVTGP